jgi:hypothetical protein
MMAHVLPLPRSVTIPLVVLQAVLLVVQMVDVLIFQRIVCLGPLESIIALSLRLIDAVMVIVQFLQHSVQLLLLQ